VPVGLHLTHKISHQSTIQPSSLHIIEYQRGQGKMLRAPLASEANPPLEAGNNQDANFPRGHVTNVGILQGSVLSVFIIFIDATLTRKDKNNPFNKLYQAAKSNKKRKSELGRNCGVSARMLVPKFVRRATCAPVLRLRHI
jgi:hypothetical protein